jgi:aspartate oxidase
MLKRGNYEVLSNAVFSTIELVYAALGLRISYDKTYISKMGATFLNEVFIMGKRVVSGLKAYIKIGLDKKLAAPTVTDLQAAVFATATGATKSGTEVAIAYKAYCFLAALEFIRLIPDSSIGSKKYALMFILPTVLGGLGGKVLNTFDNTLKSSSCYEQL